MILRNLVVLNREQTNRRAHTVHTAIGVVGGRALEFTLCDETLIADSDHKGGDRWQLGALRVEVWRD